jgi:DNA/RNA-binding domain of Phe-tRNA-synthetase-like protein
MAAPEPHSGFVEAEVADEFPGLRLSWVTVAVRPGPSPPALRRRLGELSNRYRGGGVITMRAKPIPQAFRAFFRQIGLDPDVHRIPSEQVAVARLVQGGLRSVDLITDACLVALVETGVPVWSLDADRIDAAGLGVRLAAAGRLVVGDGAQTCCALFDDPWPECAVSPRTRRVTLYTLAVDGVPEIHVEEALWCALDLLAPESGW